ncbi:hypothetical protein [Thermococcus thioreducens]|uniref:Cell division GTPase n=1 Tax=Thermococcus thioreducens TaxID=277988 RepID=A0A0Q2MSJ9_9EURY|nr:hypothetical protein [Thermococcus thioreducens]ASJ12064.1 hypothetical protein A3L14_03840 [Thermococcus thioreducens]KQH82719.1 hypothetical protein AMR53_03725 [Thermococcus thioreducens]SEW09084.1 hypothetical protein SAMN05216170_1504 [Thermococcus thioreducens]
MVSFTHLFVGIGNTGARIVNSITADGAVKVTVNPAYYLLPRSSEYEERLRGFFSRIPENTFLWLVFDDKDINHELREIIVDSTPKDTIKLAYVLTPRKELVVGKRPSWADDFETVFYDSLWDFFADENVSLSTAFQEASKNIAAMFSRLYYYLETQMLVNIDYADLFNMIRGGNVGILRLLREVDFGWHWGIWDRGLIGILVGKEFPLRDAHGILASFQEILADKDVIWGVVMDENLTREVEILALLVKRW